jgi:uncharacterized protein (DUF983 family)
MAAGESPTENKGQSGIVSAALFGLCPSCGAKALFAGAAQLADECRVCELDILSLERGGRFVGVVPMVVALVLILSALGVDEWLRPPLWASFAFWAPVKVASVIFALRLWKTMWAYRQYEESQQP